MTAIDCRSRSRFQHGLQTTHPYAGQRWVNRSTATADRRIAKNPRDKLVNLKEISKKERNA
jgi:hypothetical protein